MRVVRCLRQCVFVPLGRYAVKASLSRSYSSDLVAEKDVWIVNKEKVSDFSVTSCDLKQALHAVQLVDILHGLPLTCVFAVCVRRRK